MAVKVIRKFRLLFDVVWGPPNDGDVATYDQALDKVVFIPSVAAGAPTTADYLGGTAQGGLSNEIVAGPTPGGELGGTWGTPTVDTVHSGSSHAQAQAAAEATAAAALSAHTGDATDAHDASAISSVAAGNLAATDVQGALNELDTEKAAVASAVMDGDAAGGVLSGTFPNPGFAADMATQAELDAHVAAADPHPGYRLESAQIVSGDIADGTITTTDLAFDPATQAELDAHLNDASDAHDASAISILDTANDFTATDVEGALAELQSDAEADAQALADHLTDASAAHAASAISYAGNTNLAAADVEAALDELDNEKQPLDSDLTAIAALADPNADRILFWDDSLGAYTFLAPGSRLLITTTTIDVMPDFSTAFMTMGA